MSHFEGFFIFSRICSFILKKRDTLSDHEEQPLILKKIGSPKNLPARLAKHNKDDVPHTAKFRPWKAEACFSFETREKVPAAEFLRLYEISAEPRLVFLTKCAILRERCEEERKSKWGKISREGSLLTTLS